MSDTQNFTGTRAVSGQHAFDTAALQEWLQAHLPGFRGPLTVEMFKGGQSNPTYKLITPERAYVMRAKPGPVAKLLPSAHAIEREFRVMSALHGTDVPVARMHVLCEDESLIGRAFYVMECVDGHVMWDQALPDMTREQRGAIYNEMNRVMAALHTVDPMAIGLETYGKPGNYFERQIGRWSKQYVASVTQPIAEMDRLMAWLPDNIPAMARDASMVSVVHGDYRLDNLMFHATEPRVLAVLDWELSTLGHPLADLANQCMAWMLPRDSSMKGLAGVDRKSLGIPTDEEYIARYCERTGRDGIDNWNFYLVFSLFRLAAIVQGIKKRAQIGTASSAEADARGNLVGPLSQLAVQLIE